MMFEEGKIYTKEDINTGLSYMGIKVNGLMIYRDIDRSSEFRYYFMKIHFGHTMLLYRIGRKGCIEEDIRDMKT